MANLPRQLHIELRAPATCVANSLLKFLSLFYAGLTTLT